MLERPTPDAPPQGNAFDAAVRRASGGDLRAAALDTVQVNIGLTCNLACHHCHVVSGPKRTEQMSKETMEHVLRLAEDAGARTLDITGGAPEMMPHFRWLVTEARRRELRVMVRTNLTILLEEGYEDLPVFFRDHEVQLVASLPCYLPENVDRQRGRRVYERSIEAIRLLNAVGYGRKAAFVLDLVYNPGGAHLPPAQADLERDYRRVLDEDYGIQFTQLIAITNMAIGRFQTDLARAGKAEAYAQLLREAFNPGTVSGLMCRHQIHVAYDGTLHDCDFNYALGMTWEDARVDSVDVAALRTRRIETAEHCFGCTAGAGSSCGGALA